MLGRAGRIGALDGNLDLLVDDLVGIVRRVDCTAAVADEPRFFQCEAQLCNTGALGGLACAPATCAAAVESDVAVTEAVSAAIAAYSAALYDRSALPLATFTEATFACVRPTEFALFSKDQYARPGFPYVPGTDDTPLRWAAAVDLATGEVIHVPAAMVFHPFAYRRSAGDKPIAPSGNIGLASAAGMAEAALAGLCQVVCHDAMALFWQAMTSPPQVTTRGASAVVRGMIERFEVSGDRVLLFDITTDNAIPSFVAMLSSERRERPAMVCGAGADLDPDVAVARALTRLAAARRCLAGARPDLDPPTPDDGWRDMIDPLDHLVIAASHANRASFDFAMGSEIRRDLGEYEPRGDGSIEADLEKMVRLIAATGHRAYTAVVAPADVAAVGIAVCRVLVPGYLSLNATHKLRALGGARLYEVPQRLGYRGISRGGADNPAPHPFAL